MNKENVSFGVSNKMASESPALSQMSASLHFSDKSMSNSSQVSNDRRKAANMQRLFAGLIPDGEEYVDSFICAYKKDILIQGRLYLSSSYLCFNSVILGIVTRFAIRLADIVSITKAKNALIFDNSIVVLIRPGATVLRHSTSPRAHSSIVQKLSHSGGSASNSPIADSCAASNTSSSPTLSTAASLSAGDGKKSPTKYFFASFFSRDRAYDEIQHTLSSLSHLPSPPSSSPSLPMSSTLSSLKSKSILISSGILPSNSALFSHASLPAGYRSRPSTSSINSGIAVSSKSFRSANGFSPSIDFQSRPDSFIDDGCEDYNDAVQKHTESLLPRLLESTNTEPSVSGTLQSSKQRSRTSKHSPPHHRKRRHSKTSGLSVHFASTKRVTSPTLSPGLSLVASTVSPTLRARNSLSIGSHRRSSRQLNRANAFEQRRLLKRRGKVIYKFNYAPYASALLRMSGLLLQLSLETSVNAVDKVLGLYQSVDSITLIFGATASALLLSFYIVWTAVQLQMSIVNSTSKLYALEAMALNVNSLNLLLQPLP